MSAAMTKPVLWSFRRCPYAMRARLAVAASGVAVELREILLRDKPAAFIAASSKATVPVLCNADGTVIDESRDIMFWALGQNDPDNWLACWQADKAAVEAFLDRLDGPFKTHLDRYKYASRYAGEGDTDHRSAGAAFLGEVNDKLSVQPALSGAELGLMDFASLPFIRQFRIADAHWFDAQPWPHLHAWLDGFLASDRFANIMTKYTPWQEGETGIAFNG